MPSTDSSSPIGFPALIATLATYYAFKSLAIVINNQRPISTPPIQALFSIARSVELPVIGALPDVPLGLFPFLLPTVIVVWLLLARTTYGRRLYAIGTNDVAGRWAGLRSGHPVQGLRRTPGDLRPGRRGDRRAVRLGPTGRRRLRQRDGAAGHHHRGAGRGGDHRRHRPGAGVVLATLLIVWLNAGHPARVRGQRGLAVPAARPGTCWSSPRC